MGRMRCSDCCHRFDDESVCDNVAGSRVLSAGDNWAVLYLWKIMENGSNGPMVQWPNHPMGQMANARNFKNGNSSLFALRGRLS